MTGHLPAIAAVSFVVTLVAIAWLRRSGLTSRLLDKPNERSLHQRPTPRIGGLGLVAGLSSAVLVLGASASVWLVGLAVVLAAVSALDDAQSLPVATRLGAHLCAAVLAIVIIGPAATPPADLGFAMLATAALAIAWMANLYNFMDGADGLAGGMGVIGFLALALAAQRAGDPDLATLCAATGAASLAFLLFNFPVAKVFLGDAGSVPLGFLAGVLGWQGAAGGVWPAWFPLLVFSPFIVDATVTLLRRLAAGEAVWRAHRSHYYQRLVLAGWSHRKLALAQWGLMAAAAASALAAREQPPPVQSAILAAWVLAYGVIAWTIDKKHPRNSTP